MSHAHENEYAQSQTAGQKISREKTWDECNESERLEFLRREVRHLRQELTAIIPLVRVGSDHLHAQDGRVVVPVAVGFSTHRSLSQVDHYDPLA